MIRRRKSDSFGLEEEQEGKIINEHKETFVSYDWGYYFGVVMFSNYAHIKTYSIVHAIYSWVYVNYT